MQTLAGAAWSRISIDEQAAGCTELDGMALTASTELLAYLSRRPVRGVTDSHRTDSNASVVSLCSHEQIVPKTGRCLAHLKSENSKNMPKHASGPHL
jgi:hypothetical protein